MCQTRATAVRGCALSGRVLPYSPTLLLPYARKPPKIPDHQPQSKSNIQPDEAMGVSRALNSRFRVSGLCIRVSGVGCNLSGVGVRESGFRFVATPAPAGERSCGSGLRFRFSGFGFRFSVFEFQISNVGFRVSGLGLRVAGSRYGFWVCVSSAGFQFSGFVFCVLCFGFRVPGERRDDRALLLGRGAIGGRVLAHARQPLAQRRLPTV